MNDLLGNLKSNIAEVSDYTDSESDESSHHSPLHKPTQESIQQTEEGVVSITINEVVSEQSDDVDSGPTFDDQEDETDDGRNEIINNSIDGENETSEVDSNNDISGNDV